MLIKDEIEIKHELDDEEEETEDVEDVEETEETDGEMSIILNTFHFSFVTPFPEAKAAF